MSIRTKNLISGRARWTALATLAIAVVGGGFFIARKAEARATSTSAIPIAFAPVPMQDRGLGVGNSNLEVDVQLPFEALTGLYKPYHIEVMTNDGAVSMEIPVSLEYAESYAIFTYRDSTGSYLVLDDMANNHTKQIALSSAQELVTVLVHPATLPDGKHVYPISCGEIVSGNVVGQGGITYPYQFSVAPIDPK